MPKRGDPETTAKEFVNLLSKGDYVNAERNFDNTMAGALPQEKLRQTWEMLIGQVGPFKTQIGSRTQRVQQYDAVLVTCKFEKDTLDVKVVLNSSGQIAGLYFVPHTSKVKYVLPSYAKPGSYSEREVTIGGGEWALPGTLTLPVGKGPFPAVVLVHGSGPQDRDETIGPNRPFRDLAFGLASKGIAVLRYEKRTKEYGAKLLPIKDSLTVKEETIDDALVAVSLLRKTGGIDAKKVFVLGHSLGGMLIPRIGKLDPAIAGFIVMAGTSRPLEDVILEQTSYIFSLDPAKSEARKSQLELIKKQVARVKDPDLSVAIPSGDLPLNIPGKYWLDLRAYHPAELAQRETRPMLFLQGERDYQVTMEDFRVWEKSLSGRPNVVFKSYKKLNHLFISGQGRSTPDEYATAGHVDGSVVADIAQWIGGQKVH